MIRIDWPASPLWPNRKAHWAENKRARDAQRQAAYWLAREAGWHEAAPFPLRGLHLSMTFCGPSRTSRYDLDGGLAAMKGAVDGIAACIGVDDSLFGYTLARGDKCKDGAVLVTVEVA